MSEPLLPPAEFAALIGQYGRSDASLDVFEDGGAVWVEGCGVSATPLRQTGPLTFLDEAKRRHFEFIAGGAAIILGETVLPRFDLGAERIATFQRALIPGELPAMSGNAVGPLVSLAQAVPGIRLDIRYATTDNFMGMPVYDRACAFARPVVAEALGRVHAALAARGFGLTVYDAYRPWAVTKLFWDVVPTEFHAFVADPAVGSKHNRGCAIDLSLCDAATGDPVDMPSRYDEPTARAHSEYRGGTSRQRWHRDVLRAAMEAEGFSVQADEWWHFDFHAWQEYPIENVNFAALAR